MKKQEEQKHATAFIVFGATGDLTQNKIYPSLYELAHRNLLPKTFHLYGIARPRLTLEGFQKQIARDIKRHIPKPNPASMNRLLSCVRYLRADLTDKDALTGLDSLIQKEEARLGHGILRVFYLALPPSLFEEVISNVETCKLGKALCTREHIRSRIIVEKPFGNDLPTAKRLNGLIRRVFNERQIYRIDHYLGKGAFQNIAAFRFANPLFESFWNRSFISHIQIHALETIGLEGRYAYYDGAGAMRDMVQSHLLQLLAYVTMEPPKDFSARSLHRSKEALLRKVTASKHHPSIVTGQYRGYKNEKGVKKGSKTETFAAVRFSINNTRWRGVPIMIRTGKNCSRKETSVVVKMKPSMMKDVTNDISFTISPKSSISIQLQVQDEGLENKTRPATLHYCRGETEKRAPVGDYERLLLDVIEGDQTLFTSSNEVMQAWRVITPFIRNMPTPKPYKKGTDGPNTSQQILPGGLDWESPLVDCPYDKLGV